MKVKITIPSSLNDITLQQYKRYLKIQEKVTDERFLNAKMIEIFCNVDLKSVMHLRLNDSEEIVKIITELFNSKPKLVKRFKLNGVEYGFQPQLDEITLGEYIDLDTFIGDWENMEKAMSVLYRPVLVTLKDKYSIEDYKVGTEGAIINMPMDAVMSSIFFLWNLGLDLSKNMTNSLEGEETEILTQFLNLPKSGAGINPSLHSLNSILEDLKISLN
tara:strand:- start:1965 stop:2615 length:651 start_codon:yes stop_codon:yes gene_type:complete